MKYIYIILVSVFLFSYNVKGQGGIYALEPRHIDNDSLQIKVEALYEKFILSQSYDEMESVQKIYLKKVNFNTNGEEMLSSGNIDAWVKENLDKTVFKDAVEAEREYKILSKANQACYKENSSYYTMLISLLATDEGLEIWHNAIVNVARKHPEKFEPDPLAKMRRMLFKQ